MKIKSILPYFGGKRGLASEIIPEFGEHAAYWEPFGGSLAIVLAKPRSPHETVNDLHRDVVNLARVVASDELAPKLYDRLQRVLYSQELYELVVKELSAGEPFTIPNLERAYLYFIASWIGRNGVSGTARTNYQMAVRWTYSGGQGGLRFANAVDTLPDWHCRLRNVCILNLCASRILSSIEDDAKVCIYCDPPYVLETRSKGGKGGSSSVYRHDFKSDPNDEEDSRMTHEELATLLRRFEKARVVVSYYDHPSLDDLYSGWTKRRIEYDKKLGNQNKRGSTRVEAPEVLFINGPSYMAEPSLLLEGLNDED